MTLNNRSPQLLEDILNDEKINAYVDGLEPDEPLVPEYRLLSTGEVMPKLVKVKVSSNALKLRIGPVEYEEGIIAFATAKIHPATGRMIISKMPIADDYDPQDPESRQPINPLVAVDLVHALAQRHLELEKRVAGIDYERSKRFKEAQQGRRRTIPYMGK
ncbi:hypothetical protein K402DRAFT_408523 [Aulographum hederae CBS 113979]|uniref:Uncharacterized protein n=1 Tax=Aulographum hederae CBS 113979 TaxID=1176131 RepID=A0A6G1GKN5_9PEZI|nr:hypothetical protein K402DRAFT_408523 [Aulographum hederae CBS 113979]